MAPSRRRVVIAAALIAAAAGCSDGADTPDGVDHIACTNVILDLDLTLQSTAADARTEIDAATDRATSDRERRYLRSLREALPKADDELVDQTLDQAPCLL